MDNKKISKDNLKKLNELYSMYDVLTMKVNKLNDAVNTLISTNDDLKEQLEIVGKQIGISEDITTLLSRNETVNLLVMVINNFLNVRQKKKNKLPDDELGAIQAALNKIGEINNKQYEEIQKALGVDPSKEQNKKENKDSKK